jgi:hypothetical protein
MISQRIACQSLGNTKIDYFDDGLSVGQEGQDIG